MGAAWGDFDEDGCIDLYISRAERPNRLYRNNCNGTFSDYSTLSGVIDPSGDGGVAWGDYDGDGWLDLYVAVD